MKIGIQVSSNLQKRTGVEEYVYQLLKHLPLVDDYKNHQFFIFTPSKVEEFSAKVLKWPFKKRWTQIRLSWEMLKNKADILFVPAHTYPIVHPKRMIIAIQGLEFEAVPEMYDWLKRKILRFLIRRNAKKADKIIVPSECTKQDLIKYYKIGPNKIFVIYHGVSEIKNDNLKLKNYIFYLGTDHKRKNVEGLKRAYKILKEKYGIKHELVLAGIEKYVSEEEKWELLKNADVFVYPSFYEGFGMPVLEAQKVGVPVVASNRGALPEILGNSALLVNPENPSEIAEGIYKVLKDDQLRNELIKKGLENIKKFSWLKCAEKTLRVIIL